MSNVFEGLGKKVKNAALGVAMTVAGLAGDVEEVKGQTAGLSPTVESGHNYEEHQMKILWSRHKDYYSGGNYYKVIEFADSYMIPKNQNNKEDVDRAEKYTKYVLNRLKNEEGLPKHIADASELRKHLAEKVMEEKSRVIVEHIGNFKKSLQEKNLLKTRHHRDALIPLLNNYNGTGNAITEEAFIDLIGGVFENRPEKILADDMTKGGMNLRPDTNDIGKIFWRIDK